MNRHAAGGDEARAAAEAADRSQAEYYLRLLSERCLELDRKIAKYRTAMARYESRGSVDDARRCRRMMRIEEHDRDRLEWMIAALHRRFPPPGVRRPAGPSPRRPGETLPARGPSVVSIKGQPRPPLQR